MEVSVLPSRARLFVLLLFVSTGCSAHPFGPGGGPSGGLPGPVPQPTGRPEPFPDRGTLQPPEPDAGTYTSSRVDRAPRLIACSEYEYPRGEGPLVRVNVRLTVTATGTPTNAAVLSVEQVDPEEADGYREAALAAVASCRYTPGELRGRAVAVRIQERFYFRRTHEGTEPAL